MFGLKQLRRRQLFNFTLTELILLILFILLLFFWFKNAQFEEKLEERENEIEQCEKDLFLCKKKSEELDTCSQQVENLEKNLREANIKISQLEAKIKELLDGLSESEKEKNDKIEKLIEENTLLREENKKLEDLVKKLNETNNSVSKDLEVCENKVREMTIRGIGLPACWPQNWIEGMPIEEYKDNKSEPIFTIRLTEKGIIVEKDFPSTTFGKQFKLLTTNQIIFNTDLNPSDFRIYMRELLDQSNRVTNVLDKNITLRKECRHRVRVFDETNDQNKKLYKQLLSVVEDYFYIYKWKESYGEYQTDTTYGYKDRQKSLDN